MCFLQTLASAQEQEQACLSSLHAPTSALQGVWTHGDLGSYHSSPNSPSTWYPGWAVWMESPYLGAVTIESILHSLPPSCLPLPLTCFIFAHPAGESWRKLVQNLPSILDSTALPKSLTCSLEADVHCSPKRRVQGSLPLFSRQRQSPRPLLCLSALLSF